MRRPARAGVLALLGLLATLAGAPAGVAGDTSVSERRPAGRDPQPRLQNRTLAVFGLGLHYLEGGRGRPVIFLHGWSGTAESWRTTATALSADLRVFVPDQIGFGSSDKPFIDYSFGTLVDALVEFMDVVGLEKASLVGHSMGARVACLFALMHPDRVEKLALVSGAGDKPGLDPGVARTLDFSTLSEARRLLTLLYYDDAARVTDAAARRMFLERVRSGSGYTLNRLFESYRRGEWPVDDLSPIVAPTLIVWGREDEVAPSSGARTAQNQIEGSKLVLLERCGHLPMVEASEPLRAALHDFLLDEGAPAVAR